MSNARNLGNITTGGATGATTDSVTTSINNLIDAAPGALNTLNELAAALGDDANFSTTVTNSIATKLSLAGGTMTGDIAMSTHQIVFDNNSQAIQIKDAGGTASYVLYQDNADTLVLGNSTNVEKIRLDTSGNEGAVVIDTNGNVGIGTTSPGKKLHIRDSVPDIRLEDTNTNAVVDLKGNTGTGSFVISTDVNNAIANSKIIFEVDNDEKVRIDNNGNVGIGTDNPLTPLHVMGNNGILIDEQGNGDSQLYFGGISGTDRTYLARSSNDFLIWNTSSGVMRFGNNDGERMRIDSSGRVMIGTTTEGVAGADELTVGTTTAGNGITIRSASNSAGALFFSDGTSGGAEYDGGFEYNHSSQFMRIISAESERVRIDNLGNFGIGTTPQSFSKLQVKATTNQHVSVFTNSSGLTIGGLTDSGGSGALRIAGATLHLTGQGGGAGVGPDIAISSSGDVAIGTTNSGGSRLHVQDNNTTTVTNNTTMLANTTFSINGNNSQGSDTMRMGPMSTGGRYFIDVSNSAGNAAYDLLLNPIGGGNVGIGTTTPFRKLTISSAFGGSALDVLDLQSSAAGGGTAPKIRFGTWAANSNTIGRIGFVDEPNYGGEFVVETNSSGGATDTTTEKFRIDKDGRVGIGTTNPVNALHVQNSGNAVFCMERSVKNSGSGFAGFNIESNSQLTVAFDDGADFVVGTASNPSTQSGFTERLKIKSSNGLPYVPASYSYTTGTGANMYIQSDGAFYRSTSSKRYKNTINDSTHGLAELLKLRSVTYKGNNDGDIILGGLIAEEVHDAGLTEFVQYNNDNEPDALSYGNMVSLCIKAIQELSAKNDALENRIKTLES